MRSFRALLIVVGVVGLVWFGWSQWQARKDAERRAEDAETSLGLAASRVVFITFERAADLKVATIRGKIAARGGYDGAIFHPRQVTTAPVTVDYFLPLASMNEGAYHWDAETKVLTIDAPDVNIGTPNIDMVNAVVKQEGVYISREAGLQMARQAAKRLSSRASEEAKGPKHLNDARESGRKTLEQMARQTLSAVGVSDAKVSVSFPWEPKKGHQPTSRWDESKPIKDVLAGN